MLESGVTFTLHDLRYPYPRVGKLRRLGIPLKLLRTKMTTDVTADYITGGEVDGYENIQKASSVRLKIERIN